MELDGLLPLGLLLDGLEPRKEGGRSLALGERGTGDPIEPRRREVLVAWWGDAACALLSSMGLSGRITIQSQTRKCPIRR